jgi:hypothetical protein
MSVFRIAVLTILGWGLASCAASNQDSSMAMYAGVGDLCGYIGGCMKSQVGDDLAEVCSDKANNVKGSMLKPECDAFWRDVQSKAAAAGPQAAAAARSHALAAGSVVQPLPN